MKCPECGHEWDESVEELKPVFRSSVYLTDKDYAKEVEKMLNA